MIIVFAIWLNSKNAQQFRNYFKELINKELIYINPPLADSKIDAIYLLGGSPKSQVFKYIKVSDLYRRGVSDRIWILSLGGITEYDHRVGRNLTNNEWSLFKLKQVGIPEENVELINVKEGFFGTFSEAEAISALLEERGYQSILLIAQPYHTHRVKISFDNFLNEQNVSMYIIDSGERMWLRHLIVEFFKLKIYEYFLVE